MEDFFKDQKVKNNKRKRLCRLKKKIYDTIVETIIDA